MFGQTKQLNHGAYIMKKITKIEIIIILILLVTSSFSVGLASTYEHQKNYDPQDFTTILLLKGLTPMYNITWSGNSSSATLPVPVVTWCNTSGILNTTMEVNLTINSTNWIHDIDVCMDNLLNSTYNWFINASNITMYISGDNITWDKVLHDIGNGNGVFTDGGGILRINDTTWGVLINNPWDYYGQEGYLQQNCSLYIRFRCNLTTYLNSPTDKYGYFYNQSAWQVTAVNNSINVSQENFTGRMQNGFEFLESCCVDVNKTVWNGTAWVNYYPNAPLGIEMMFNISIHNCGETPTGNMTIYDTHYDALSNYVPNSAYITLVNCPPTKLDPFSITWENSTCEYPGHGHITWHIPRSNLTNFTYCNHIYLNFNMTSNNTDYSKNEVTVYMCEFDFDWWDSECYYASECYINEEFDTSINCTSSNQQASEWLISEHINRPCVGNGCYDEVWNEYETEFERWSACNASDTWEWVYGYNNLDGNGTDSHGLSYTIANQSDINRSMSLLRARYNVSNFYEGITEPCVGLIYAFTNDTHYDMVLYGYDEIYLLSKRNFLLLNTNDSSVVTTKSTAYDYYNSAWSRNTSMTPYDIDPETSFDPWNGIWIKTIYNELNGHLQTKAWQINATQPFGLHYELPGWIINETLSNTIYNESKCFGLVVWNPDNTTNFTADFDFIEEWRLNYSRDEQANASELANHPIYGSDGIPLISFPVHSLNEYMDMLEDYYYGCWYEYNEENITAQQFGDCTTCYYQNLSNLFGMESRQFDKNVITAPNEEDQKDNIYYYTTVTSNLTGDAPFNNSLYIQIEECTDGSEDSYDGAVVCIDIDNNQVWDANDMAFYWYTVGPDTWYVIYKGTTAIYYDKTTSFVPGMEVIFGAEFTNTSYDWYNTLFSLYPPVHRFSPHRLYHINIPLYYLEKGYVGSQDYLNVNETFGLNIMTTENDYEYSPVWENWNETDESYYTVDNNDAETTWATYMNCTNWAECVDFEEGIWNGVTSTQMQYWAHGRIQNNSGYLEEALYEINATKITNISVITNLAVDTLVNYTITICNTGDNTVTNVTVNDTLPANIEYVYSSLPTANVTNPSDNIYIFNLTTTLHSGDCLSFNITVNFTAGCYTNGTEVINNITASTDRTNTSANNTMQYGSNHAPIIVSHYPIFDRDGTSILLRGINVTVTDDDTDNMNITFYTNMTNGIGGTGWVFTWNAMGTNTSVNNGTYTTNQTFNNSQHFNTRWRWGNTFYYWTINITDGQTWTNASYSYRTNATTLSQDARYDIDTDNTIYMFDLNTDYANRYVHGGGIGTNYYGIYDVDNDGNVYMFDLNAIWAHRTS